MLMAPAVPPLPTISKRSFHAVGSLMAKPASGQMTPRTSQCSGRLGFAGTSVAEFILTWSPKDLAARASHLMAGSAANRAAAHNGISQRDFMGGPFNITG